MLLLCAEGRGAALKAVFGYLLGPSVQGAATSYQQFPLNPQVSGFPCCSPEKHAKARTRACEAEGLAVTLSLWRFTVDFHGPRLMVPCKHIEVSQEVPCWG